MLEETHRQTHLERLGALGLEVIGGILRLRVPRQAAFVPRIERVGNVAFEGDAHRGERTAQLDIGEIFRHVGNELRQHDRKSDRRIEERLGVRMRTRQLRRPVVATRKGQVVGALVSHLGRSEDRLRLLTPAFLLTDGLGRITQVLNVEDVGQPLLLARRTVGNGAADLQGVVLHIRERSTDVGLQRPVVTERFIDIEQSITINLAVHRLGDAVKAVGGLLGELHVRGSIHLFGVGVVRVVDADAA